MRQAFASLFRRIGDWSAVSQRKDFEKAVSRLVVALDSDKLKSTDKADARKPENVTLVQLIANPEKFDGKLVRIIGFLRLEFEGNALYLHREDYVHSIHGNGVWVEVTPEIAKHKESLQMHYVLLEGIFDSKNRGHMGMCSGSLTKIQRAEAWVNERPDQPKSR